MDLSEDALRSIISHLAHLRAEYGEVLADAELVEPNGEYFPDAFAVEPAAIGRLLQRMSTYAPLSGDLSLGLGFIEPDQNASGGSCGPGACGDGSDTKEIARRAAVETDDGYGVLVHVADTGDTKLLTTSLARGLGRIVLFEAGEDVDPRDEGAVSELTAVASGFGLILLNGACVYKKGCGGVKRHQGTFLGVEELALALALFVRVNDKKPGIVRKYLDVTQKEAFDVALAWVDDQPKLVRALGSQPETLTDGVFEIESKKGFLARVLSRKRVDEDEPPPDAIASAARARSEERTDEERRRIAEMKALVEEALQES